MSHRVCVYLGDALASYNFGATHPFGPQRHHAFAEAFHKLGLDTQVDVLAPVLGNEQQLLSFHTPAYVAKVKAMSRQGQGILDSGDTPAFPGMYEAALHVVGTTLDAVRRVMAGEYRRAFVPIAGLHHARRDTAAGFCIFNDCGIAIEQLRRQYHLKRLAYVDIDAHHGDGVFYSFEADPDLCFADMHEDGRFLYPGTGAATETGQGLAKGSKLNLPMPMFANDELFLQCWPQVEAFVREARPQFILFQCGADSLDGDPITHLRYSSKAHAHAATRLCQLADELCEGRLVAMGGGGYDLANLARAWCAVVSSLIEQTSAV
jgi:acetoin utilization protein AcuC